MPISNGKKNKFYRITSLEIYQKVLNTISIIINLYYVYLIFNINSVMVVIILSIIVKRKIYYAVYIHVIIIIIVLVKVTILMNIQVLCMMMQCFNLGSSMSL